MKPITFSTEMTRAILAGRKTQTRRLAEEHILPKYNKDDILWVRETWALVNVDENYAPPCYVGESYHYKADNDGIETCGAFEKWEPSTHMPREAARIFLKITDVRAERLQDITPKDVASEGIRTACGGLANAINKSAFAELWDKIYAEKGFDWDKNPWVWVYEFEKISKGDAGEEAHRHYEESCEKCYEDYYKEKPVFKSGRLRPEGQSLADFMCAEPFLAGLENREELIELIKKVGGLE
jgi:hypothetical protein